MKSKSEDFNVDDGEGDEYSECYPSSSFDLKSFRAKEKDDTQSSDLKHNSNNRNQRDKKGNNSSDRKIARDLNNLEQWKRNAQEREAKESSSSSSSFDYGQKSAKRSRNN